MSKNIKQVYDTNPITTNTSTDLMYFGQSPYGATNDAGMTYSNFSNQFTLKVQTTKGDLIGFSTLPVRVAVGANGKLLQADSTNAAGISWSTTTFPTTSATTGKIIISDGTNWIASTSIWPNTVGSTGAILRSNGTSNAYTTSTFADTYSVSTILYASSANTVTGLATTNRASLSTNATGVPTWLAMTDGQIVIGSTAGAPAAASLSAGSGITITPGSNSISIAAASGAGSPLTTKGDLYTYSTTNDRLAVGTTNGQILQVNSAASTGLAWSTATYPVVATSTGSFVYANGTNFVASTSLWPNTVGSAGKIIRSDGTTNAYTTSTFADTYSASTILYSNGANTVTGLATANSSVLVTTSAGVPVQSGTMTNGQMIIGSTGATPAVGTITASGNITVTTGAGTLALSATGAASTSFVVETTTSRTFTAFQSVIANNAGLVTITVPATAAVGDEFEVVGLGAGLWKVQANTGQIINLGSSPTSSAGSLTATNRYDALKFVCVVANTTFVAQSVIGNLTVA